MNETSRPNLALRFPLWLSALPGRITGSLFLAAALALAGKSGAQTATLTDIGSAAPTPGANDIAQLAQPSGANSPDGLNYYFDNSNPPGQTFTTGPNVNGYVLTSLALATAGNGGNLPAGGQAYTLRIYSVSGATATLVATYTSQNTFTFTEVDWLQWTGLSLTLQPNATYAYSFQRVTTGWENMANVAGNLYAGGQVALIPPAGGTLIYGSSHSYSASFDIGLTLPSAPIVGSPGTSPSYTGVGVVAGTKVTLSATASGLNPITYQWQTDNGTGGALVNIPGATGTNLVVDTSGWALGTYQYDFVAHNALGDATSPATPIVIVPSAMIDLGTTAPTPGPNDITQFQTGNANMDGFNYYTDNGAGHGNWCGQSFTTGTNNNGYVLQTLSWLSAAGSTSGFNNWQLYDLYFYSLSADGKTATLIANYQMNGGGTSGDWLQFVGISVPLAPNSHYAYTFGRDASATGWQGIYAESGNPYPGGQILTIANANTNGGPVTYGASGNSDQVFDLGLVISQKPFAGAPTYTPFINPIYGDTPVTLNEVGVGTPPLTYQWLTDNGSGGALVPVPGATGTNLVVTPSGSLPQINYAVIVRNQFGSSTSAPVTLNITAPSAPQLVTDISPVSSPAGTNQGYVGQTVTYSATFDGTLPITYQWYQNGSPILAASNPSAISNTLVLPNLQIANAGTYYVLARNSEGSLPSSSSSLGVLTPPAPPAPNTYASAIISEGPVAYWRLNDAGDPSTGITPAYDASGNNNDGVFGANTQNGFDGVAGPSSPTFPGFEANNNALGTQIGLENSFVTVPALNLNTNAVTISLWINPSGAVAANGGLVMYRNGNDGAGLGFGNNVNAAGVAELGYWWNTNSPATYNFNSSLYPPVGIWSYVALVIAPNQTTIYLYYIDPNTGKPALYSAVNPVPNGPEPFTGATNTVIGTDLYSPNTRVFDGSIDEVAVFNSALTSDQILAQFSKAAGLGPVAASISGQPQSTSGYAGKTVTISATGINGTSPITYQWQLGGINLTDGGNISGSHTPTLTISNAVPGNSGNYKLLVTNPVGVTPSSNAVVSVVNPVPGSYEAQVLANNPFAFWKLNETTDPSTGNAVATDYAGTHNGNYETGAQNGFNGILGPESPAFPGFPSNNYALGTAANTALSYVSAPLGTLMPSALTLSAWINPSGPVQNWAGILMDRGSAGEGLGFGGSVDATGMSELGYTWNANSTWSYNSYLYPPANQWSFVAVVIQPSQAVIYLINANGTQSATNAIGQDTEAFGSALRIGNDAAEGNTAGGRTFPGSISDAAVYLTALSPSQITALYNAALGIVPQPVTLHITSGAGTATLTWSSGTLQEATSPAGPWTSTSATSPYTVGTTNSSTFFRVQVQ